MMTTTALANTSIMPHDFHLYLVVRTLKIYSLGNFQVHNTLLLTIITMMYIRSRTYSSYNWKFILFDQHLPTSPTPNPW